MEHNRLVYYAIYLVHTYLSINYFLFILDPKESASRNRKAK